MIGALGTLGTLGTLGLEYPIGGNGIGPPPATYHILTQNGKVLATQSGLELRKVQST